MLREKNGRFAKNTKVEIDIPSLSSIIKFFMICFILAPWFYLILYKADIKELVENAFAKLFGPVECTCPRETPY